MIMKKLFNSIFVIIAAMVTFAGCAKEEIAAPETKTVQFFAESIETKTAFGTPDGTTYPTLWTENDENVQISLNLTGSKQFAVIPSDDFTTATFEGEFEDDNSGAYTFYSVSPAVASISFSADYKSYNLEIPTTQTPTATSVDEKAQILVAASETFTEFPSVVNFAYEHFTAYGKLSLTNLALGDAKVSSVSLTADKNFAYRYYFYPATGEIKENGSTKTITINTTSLTDIWFACAPVDMSNSTMEVVVNTDKGTFTKTVTFPAERKFESGKISKFAVNMSGVTLSAPEVYELVTDAIQLTPDSKVIIVSGEKAISTNQKSNNRAAAAVNLSADKTTISTPGADVQILTIEEGVVSGTVAFNTGSGYLYAASSSSNHLKTQTTLDENGSWLVTFADGVTSVVAQGANTRNLLKYNESSDLFSCYGSGQTDVAIYKLKGSGSVLENYLKVSTEEIHVGADETTATFTVSSDLEWTVSKGAGMSVSTNENTVTVSFGKNSTTSEKTYTVTVSATGVESKTVRIIQAGQIKVDPSFTAGEYWIMGTKNDVTRVMTPLAATSPYGYAQSVEAVDNKSFAANAFKFTAVNGGYTIQDASGRYYYQEEGTTYKTFNAGTDGSLAGCVWTVSIQNDGTALITNAASGKVVKFADGTYTSFGVYGADDTNDAVYPMLVKADNALAVELASIAVSGQTTSYNIGDTFSFDGTVTAKYNDGTTKTVTPTSVSQPDMTEAASQTVTVTYTEGNVTKTTTYTINIKDPNAGGSTDSQEVTETITFDANKTQRISYSGDSQVWASDNVTFTNNKASSSNAVADYTNPVRLYQGSEVVIEAVGKIAKIVIVSDGTAKYKTALENSLTGAGLSFSPNGNNYTVTVNNQESVKFALTAQARLKSIEVTYTSAN